MTTRRVDLRAYAFGFIRARRLMTQELLETSARIESEINEMRRDVKAMRDELARLQELRMAVEAERNLDARLH